jgi:hypothetical protein
MKQMPEQRESLVVKASDAADYLGSITNRHANWRDVIVEMTRTAPFVMLGAAFIAGAISARRR